MRSHRPRVFSFIDPRRSLLCLRVISRVTQVRGVRVVGVVHAGGQTRGTGGRRGVGGGGGKEGRHQQQQPRRRRHADAGVLPEVVTMWGGRVGGQTGVCGVVCLYVV